MAGPTPNPFGKAFACAAIAFVVIFALLRLSFGPPADPPYLAGEVTSLVVIPALVVGIWAHNSKRAWSLARLIAFYLVFQVIAAVVSVSGSITSTRH